MEQHARRALDVLGDQDPLGLMSMIRLRRDLPDGQADHELLCYRKALKPVIHDIGGKSILASRVLYTFAGIQDHWDVVLVTWFPSKHAMLRSHHDPRIAMAMRHRDQGFEDMLSLQIRPYARVTSP